MVVLEQGMVFSGSTDPTEPKIISNVRGEVLTIQVGGQATSVSVKLEGNSVLSTNVFSPISSLNLGDYSIAKTITKPGLYQVGIDGVSKIKVTVTGVTGGEALVSYRVTQGG